MLTAIIVCISPVSTVWSVGRSPLRLSRASVFEFLHGIRVRRGLIAARIRTVEWVFYVGRQCNVAGLSDGYPTTPIGARESNPRLSKGTYCGGWGNPEMLINTTFTTQRLSIYLQ